ncbi:MAG: hydrogenase maturation nickel metallochaperone HypA [Syntrophales bacterium]|nr:hydrogenase maturation nickel metallochaperone HypA [Syntrophales bacterium]
MVESLLDIVEEYARRESFKCVKVVRLSMGRFSHVVPDALRFAFEIRARDSIAEGARIDIDILPASLYCFPCEREMEMESSDLVCPKCGSREVLLVKGMEELKLLELEVE